MFEIVILNLIVHKYSIFRVRVKKKVIKAIEIYFFGFQLALILRYYGEESQLPRSRRFEYRLKKFNAI